MAFAPKTAMMLANAICLKSRWASTFGQQATCPREFILLDGQCVEVPAMDASGSYPCARTADFELLAKPYAGGRLAFVVVLPEVGRFRDVRDRLSWATVRRVLGSTEERRMKLSLPKFSLTSSPDVDSRWKSRGARRVYSPATADLSAMSPQALTPGHELYVGQTIHRARIDVDEEGTEAAAVTVIEAPAGARLAP